jgi:hypothetical protein
VIVEHDEVVVAVLLLQLQQRRTGVGAVTSPGGPEHLGQNSTLSGQRRQCARKEQRDSEP